MKFTCFTLMPYRPLDMRQRNKYKSAWVNLPNSLYDPVKGADEYESYIGQLASAEKLGFDAIAVNEHHQTAYGMMPAPNLIASALIQRTRTVKIAVLGRALPLVSNPLTIAEEFAMLDALSRGRLVAGFVRGIGLEYHAMGLNPSFSHERYLEAHDLIVQAWTKPGPTSFEGEHYNFRYVNIWPTPYQRPHPPVWIPSQGSSETISWASAPERKYPFMVTFSAQDLVVRYLQMYREQARKWGYEPAGGQMGFASPIYVAETEERAIEEARAGVETLFNDYLYNPWELLLPPGYMSLESAKRTMKMRSAIGTRPRQHTLESLMENGTVLVGTPAQVRERIERTRDATGAEHVIAMLQFGVLPDDLAKRNMEMFASEVMPKLRS